MPPASKPAEIPAAPQSVRSLVATAVDWPRVRAPHPSRPSFGPALVEQGPASNAPLPALLPPRIEAPEATAPVASEEPKATAPVLVEEETIALVVEDPAPAQEVAIVIPAPPPSAIEIPPSVVDVAQPRLDESTDIIVVDDEQAIRRMRGNRKMGLFVGLSLVAVAVATVVILVFAR